MFGKIGLNGFKLDFGQSNKKMDIVGSIGEFYLSDYSNYPNTIIKEQAEYTVSTKLIESYNKKRNMITFDIKIL